MEKEYFLSANILIPQNVDYNKWACVACDQFTGDIEYWNKLKSFIGEEKSTLKTTLPEIYLTDNLEKRIENVHKTIKEYLENGVFSTLKDGYVLTVRSTPYKKRRIGLIGAIDLEDYDYKKGTTALIRATEGTIEERIPPRLKIRKNAEVEFPHVMVLYDDEKKEINENLYKEKDKYKKIYDFDLNMDGGHIEGYFIPKTKKIPQAFNGLLDKNRLKEKYGKEDKFLFAVGDGNHSLATAKAHWEEVKKTLSKNEIKSHPARFSLVEVVNIYDDGIYFEPIYRFINVNDIEKFNKGLENIDANFKYYCLKKETAIKKQIDLPNSIKSVDEYIKGYIESYGGEVDYIHGIDGLKNMVDKTKNSVGIIFDKMDKGELFKFVSKNGALPRKTFSMGEGKEKRYYLEGRKIVK